MTIKTLQSSLAKRLSLLLAVLMMGQVAMMASSHREAPLIAYDPLADNVDVYAFRSPDAPNTVTLIATYVPLQLPHGGPIYYNFGENIRYEIHIDNDASTTGDDIIYRFTFTKVNNDPTTFFLIRFGENQQTTYTLEKSTDGGSSFTTVISNGVVPPPNVGERSITGGPGPGLGAPSYTDLMMNSITTASSGEKVFCGQSDDPFFVDIGGIFDLGDAPRQNARARDGVACYNVSTIAIQVDIADLLNDAAAATPTSILDPNYVIGVWASASRPAMKTLNGDGTVSTNGDWVQVSRLGMPLTNEVIIPIGMKDMWNASSPYDDAQYYENFYNPELALYMDEEDFALVVPAFEPLWALQKNSLGAFDFTNGADGLFPLKGSDAVEGTALDDDLFGGLLLPGPGLPRSVDLWPIFHTGIPNVRPYQLATGKDGDPLAAGKPFANNFLPTGAEMLRLNMAVPVTDRDDPNFSSLGLFAAAALGVVSPQFNDNTDLEFIPNMDGFPNGRRLEDDVTRIELQAVGGLALAAIGLFYDDFDPATDRNPITPDLVGVVNYTTGVEKNDRTFQSTFPYVAVPFSGKGRCSGIPVNRNGMAVNTDIGDGSGANDEGDDHDEAGGNAVEDIVSRSMSVPENGSFETAPMVSISKTYPVPAVDQIQVSMNSEADFRTAVRLIDVNGKVVETKNVDFIKGENQLQFDVSNLTTGAYFIAIDGMERKMIMIQK